jgi:F-type H+-transporting ATPase subunit epsilon
MRHAVAQQSSTSDTLRCVVVTPEATVIDTAAVSVVLPMADGEYGILPAHSPLIGRLGYGELRIRTRDGQKRFYADGGFVQVADNVISVLTNRAVPPDSLDAAAANELLQTALVRPAAGDEELAIRARSIAQARGQLRVAGRTA